jgi:putative hydrolase of HD superfamily
VRSKFDAATTDRSSASVEGMDMGGVPASLSRKLRFLVEIDRLKDVVRQSPLISGRRRENSAEHSWHLAMFAIVLADFAPGSDPVRAVRMLLIHDIVEIDVGDHPVHSLHADRKDLALKEDLAAERIFGLLPDIEGDELLSLWREFEASRTADARFAKALDRLQPLIVNIFSGGGTWNENELTEADVFARYGPVIEAGSPRLWQAAKLLVEGHFKI